ncbi:hypothetical protein AAFF_G00120730 [Aldrovandia affinis]|uniref:Cilia- and flagella-associated protein 61 N-terminal domain-containing protein n=1 Tax=Aldrovandia affinis TaxID=143900 RepID=A0AAD7RSG1_9TELE|nr:hypothetical protein AAFF_G00120730 [Aldrovandia affinis]
MVTLFVFLKYCKCSHGHLSLHGRINMRTATNWSDDVESITVRRTESSDAREISELIGPATEAVFGRVNVIYLLEKANLAVTVTNSKNEVLAHAAFLDHPSSDIIDPADWEPWFRKHFSSDKCTPLNTLFLHLFVAQSDFSLGSAKEIVRVEDHDDLTHILSEQTKVCCASYGPYFLAELIEAQDDDLHAAVCEKDGAAVGFISLSSDVNLKLLNECFDLGPFNGLYKARPVDPPQPEEHEEPVPETIEPETPEESGTKSDQEPEEEVTEKIKEATTTSDQEPEEEDPEPAPEPVQDDVNAFCIQLFFIDKKCEMRSVDFLPYIFTLFPARDFCVISVPKVGPEFPLLQAFFHVTPRGTSTLPHELYVCHRSGLLKPFEVRAAVSSDRLAVEALVMELSLRESMLEEMDMFCHARQNKDGTPMHVLVAQVLEQVVGIVIIKNEEDIEYIRAHYNIENFHYARHFLKEALRLGRKTCLYCRIYPPRHAQSASADSLVCALSCMVPVRPRRQIICPLEELGVNAPSTQVTDEQAPYALNHINRKLTMEPKVTVNIRIVVVGASDTAISFLEVFAFCPHLRFNNLTLISSRGLPEHCSRDEMCFLTSSHSYNDRDHAQLSLRSWVHVIVGKMTAINRAGKYVLVSGDRKVPYDHLILCTGQQYQVPCLGESSARPGQRHAGPVPSNLFTLNDHEDCSRARRWLQENFVDLEGDAVVYGDSIDAYACVETLLRMGVRGSRIHLVHPPAGPSGPARPCFAHPAVERAVGEALRGIGVRVHRHCLLARVNGGRDLEPLSSVSFATDSQPVT